MQNWLSLWSHCQWLSALFPSFVSLAGKCAQVRKQRKNRYIVDLRFKKYIVISGFHIIFQWTRLLRGKRNRIHIVSTFFGMLNFCCYKEEKSFYFKLIIYGDLYNISFPCLFAPSILFSISVECKNIWVVNQCNIAT